MLLSPEEIKQQTRNLWRDTFHDDEDFLSLYFDEKYSDRDNFTLRPNGYVAAAMQMLPYRVSIYGQSVHAGYVSGLCVMPDFRRHGLASRLLFDSHRRLYQQGGVLSFLIPSDDSLRAFYEKPQHGAFWTTTYRKETPLPQPEGETPNRLSIVEAEAWTADLYVYFRRHTAREFMVHPSETDFFVALDDCSLAGGHILVAYQGHRICGICLAVRETDGRAFVRSLVADDGNVRDAFVRRLQQDEKVEQVFARVPAPGSAPEVKPYAIARVVNVERFLSAVMRAYPDLEMSVGVDGDLFIPENNGYYRLAGGRVSITDERPETIVTPGGLAALFLSSYPMYVEMMLDE